MFVVLPGQAPVILASPHRVLQCPPSLPVEPPPTSPSEQMGYSDSETTGRDRNQSIYFSLEIIIYLMMVSPRQIEVDSKYEYFFLFYRVLFLRFLYREKNP